MGLPPVDWHQLKQILPSLERHRTEIAQRRVPLRGIVEALNVIEHVGLGVIARALHPARRACDLKRGDETLHRRIVFYQ